MNYNYKVIFVLLFLFVDNNYIFSKEKKTISFINFETTTQNSSNSSLFLNSLESSLLNYKNYELIQKEKQDLINNIRKSSLFVENSKKNAVSVGKFLNINYLLMGNIISNKYVTIKVVNVDKDQIIFSETHEYKNMSNILELSPKLAANINHAITTNSFDPFNIFINYSYFVPQGNLKTKMPNGHGISLLCAYQLSYIKNLLIGIEVQYYKMDRKNDVTYQSSINPYLIYLGYLFKYNSFSFIPNLSFGKSRNSLSYYLNTNLEDYNTEVAWEYIYSAGFKLGYILYGPFSLYLGMNISKISNGLKNRFCTYSAGSRFNF